MIISLSFPHLFRYHFSRSYLSLFLCSLTPPSEGTLLLLRIITYHYDHIFSITYYDHMFIITYYYDHVYYHILLRSHIYYHIWSHLIMITRLYLIVLRSRVYYHILWPHVYYHILWPHVYYHILLWSDIMITCLLYHIIRIICWLSHYYYMFSVTYYQITVTLPTCIVLHPSLFNLSPGDSLVLSTCSSRCWKPHINWPLPYIYSFTSCTVAALLCKFKSCTSYSPHPTPLEPQSPPPTSTSQKKPQTPNNSHKTMTFRHTKEKQKTLNT